MPSREERLAANEARFREINESAQPRRESEGEGRYVCECADAGCVAWIELTSDEYRRVRSDPMHFAIKPGHEVETVETVIERNDRFYVVEKPSSIAHIVDPPE